MAKKRLTKEEQRALELKRSPLAFAERYLHSPADISQPFEALWCQRPILVPHGNRLNTIRAQRGCGKTESAVALMLHYACTHKNHVVLVIGPSKMVVQRVFERLLVQIDNSDFLAGSVTSRLKTPWQVTFTTGTIIRGLSTGVASKQEAKAIRGEHPHLMYIDEADYLDDADWTGFSSLIDPPQAGAIKPVVYATTTPTGKRSYFYKLCEEKGHKGAGKDWIDWWFPARHVANVTFEGEFTTDANGWPVPVLGKATIRCTGVNDEWTKEADDRQRNMNGEQAWYHEIIAWWGDATYAVWSKKLIEAAMERGKRFTFLGERVNSGQRFTGGVDIDESQACPNFCIIEYLVGPRADGTGGIYVVRLREEMERPESGKIYHGLKQRVVQLHRNFGPEAIYIDRGYGSLYVDEIIGLGLRSVHGKWFRENVEIQNDKGDFEKKPLKHVMIAHATRLFEEGRIAIAPVAAKSIDYDVYGNPVESEEPTWDTEFITDLLNYMVLRVTKTGVPEYTSKREHSIDAFLLALFAAVEHFDNPFQFRMDTEATKVESHESAILGGSLASQVVQVAGGIRDRGEPTCTPMTADEYRNRAQRRPGSRPPPRSYAEYTRTSF